MSNGRVVAVLGAGGSEQAAMDTARELGGLLASRNYVLVRGLGGIMRAASEGVRSRGGPGTLAEIALAKKIDKDVIAIDGWSGIKGIIPAPGPAEALDQIERILGKEER